MSTVLTYGTKLLAGLVIFAGLPLLGWGLLDTQAFASHPARLGYLVLVFVLQVAVVLTVPNLGRHQGAGQKTVRRQSIVVLFLQALSVAIILAAPFSDRWNILTLGRFEGGRYLGLALYALGFGMMNWAEAALGRLFSVQVTIQVEHRLVTEGPYRYLRHPRYAGILLYNLGVALTFRSGLALLLTTVLLGVLLWRIHDEEALLHTEFGSAWETYAARSWQLVPFVY